MKRKMKISVFAVWFLILNFGSILVAQENGRLSGFIHDAETGRPIPDANIILHGTKYGTISHDDGFYYLEQIPPGDYNLTVRVIGYQVESQNIQISSNSSLNFELTPQPIPVERIIVTATRTDHLQSKITMPSLVIDYNEINQRNGSTVGELVENTNGTFVKNYGGFAGIQTASIRGSNADQVLVLLDGRRLNTVQGGGVDLNNFPLANIERIEIIRGSNSAIYGSDAMGGMINLISRSAASSGISFGVKSVQGSFGLNQYDVYGSQKIGVVQYFFNYNYLHNDGDFKYKSPTDNTAAVRKNNDYASNTLFLKTKLDIDRRNSLQFIHQTVDTDRGVAGAISFPSLSARRDERRSVTMLQAKNRIGNHLRLETQLYNHVYRHHYSDPQAWIPEDDVHKSTSQGIDMKSNIIVMPQFLIIAGAELERERMESTQFSKKNRDKQGLFLQTEWSQDFILFNKVFDFKLIPALRWDRYAKIGEETSPKIGALLSTGEEANLVLRGNYGQSYRVPSFNDLYWPEDDYTKGNPDLLPETATNYDAGLLLRWYRSGLFQTELTYFQNHFQDLMIWQPGDDGKWSVFNVGKANIHGIEGGFSYYFPRNIANIKFFHTWMKSTDETPGASTYGKPLNYRPDNKTNIMLGLNLTPFTVHVEYNLTGKRFIDQSNSLPSYRLINGNIGYSYSFAAFTVDTKLEMRNLLDKSIQIMDGYPTPGREFRISLGFRNNP